MPESNDLPLEKIFGTEIYELSPNTLDAEMKWSLEAVGDPSVGFDPLGPDRERLLGWVRQGGGRSFRIHPLSPAATRELEFLPHNWESDKSLHPTAIKAAHTIAAAYELPADLEVLILENKEIWVAKK